jgi:hypothetical protein
MKSICKFVKTVANDERGLLLPMALVLMFVGAILIVPMLQFRANILNIDMKMEQSMKGRYAADAGLNEVIWQFIDKKKAPVFPYYNPWSKVNNMDVYVEKLKEDISGNKITYTLESTAKLGGQTKGQVISQIEVEYYSGLLDNAITSKQTLTIDKGEIEGPIVYEGTYSFGKKVTYDQEPEETTITYWPDTDLLKAFYWEQVKNESVIPTPISGTIGPGYTISHLTINGNITLNGTVYVQGNLYLPNNLTINLNGNTIFVEDNIGNGENSLTLQGSGCVIALGDIIFKNCTQSDPNDFVFIMSVNGLLEAKNNLEVYGSIAAQDVIIKNNAIIENDGTGGPGLNFPGNPGSSGTVNSVTVKNYSN